MWSNSSATAAPGNGGVKSTTTLVADNCTAWINCTSGTSGSINGFYSMTQMFGYDINIYFNTGASAMWPFRTENGIVLQRCRSVQIGTTQGAGISYGIVGNAGFVSVDNCSFSLSSTSQAMTGIYSTTTIWSNMTNVSISTAGTPSYGIYSNGGAINLVNCSIWMNSSGSATTYGVKASTILTASNSTVRANSTATTGEIDGFYSATAFLDNCSVLFNITEKTNPFYASTSGTITNSYTDTTGGVYIQDIRVQGAITWYVFNVSELNTSLTECGDYNQVFLAAGTYTLTSAEYVIHSINMTGILVSNTIISHSTYVFSFLGFFNLSQLNFSATSSPAITENSTTNLNISNCSMYATAQSILPLGNFQGNITDSYMRSTSTSYSCNPPGAAGVYGNFTNVTFIPSSVFWYCSYFVGNVFRNCTCPYNQFILTNGGGINASFYNCTFNCSAFCQEGAGTSGSYIFLYLDNCSGTIGNYFFYSREREFVDNLTLTNCNFSVLNYLVYGGNKVNIYFLNSVVKITGAAKYAIYGTGCSGSILNSTLNSSSGWSIYDTLGGDSNLTINNSNVSLIWSAGSVRGNFNNSRIDGISMSTGIVDLWNITPAPILTTNGSGVFYWHWQNCTANLSSPLTISYWNATGSSSGSTTNNSLYWNQTLTINVTGTYSETFLYSAQLANASQTNLTVLNSTGSKVPFTLTNGYLNWSGAPSNYSINYTNAFYFINGTVFPGSGNNSTIYSFVATVMNLSSSALTLTCTIDGSPHAMSQTSSSTWLYSSLLPVGSHQYWFSCTDGTNYSSIQNQTLVVSLSLPASFYLAGGTVLPGSGNNSTSYAFLLSITNLTGPFLSPSVYIDTIAYPMSQVSPILWSYSTLLPVGLHTYWFAANDGSGNYSSIANQTLAVSLAPAISFSIQIGTVLPSVGNNSTQFHFIASIQNLTGPSLSAFVSIDGTSYPLSPISPSLLSYITLLPVGLHTYWFYASDTSGNYSSIDNQTLAVAISLPTSFSLQNGTVLPSAGNNSTVFNFILSVQNLTNPSLSPAIILDNISRDMTWRGPSLWTYSTTLPNGPHTYWFEASDGAGNYSFIDNQSLTVSLLPDLPPVSGQGLVMPPSGTELTQFNFLLTSQQPYPAYSSLWVNLSIPGVGLFPMTLLPNDLYSYTTTLPVGTWHFSFHVSNANYSDIVHGGIIAVTPSANLAPIIINSGILPAGGDTITPFSFFQDTFDPENASLQCLLVLDGTSYPMSGTTHFFYSATLPAGLHSYHFTATDGVLVTQTIPSSIDVSIHQYIVRFLCPENVLVDIYALDMTLFQTVVVQSGSAQTSLEAGSYSYVYHYLGNDSETIPFEVFSDTDIPIQLPPVPAPTTTHGSPTPPLTLYSALAFGIVLAVYRARRRP